MTRRLLFTALALAVLVPAFAVAAEVTNETGVGTGTLIGSSEGGCGTLLFNSDETYENGYTWSYGGIVAPCYGAFVECYRGRRKSAAWLRT
ncbi:MAG: hypothetical protein R3E97_19400 [Candidatus Eisenbacteria bacterium]